jgi:hypothetical protein
VEVGEELSEHLVTVAARTLKDPVHRVFVYAHNPGSGTDTVALGETSHHSLNHVFIHMEAKEHRIATLRESALTGSTAKQFGFVFTIGVITNEVALSLLRVILAFLVGTEALGYIHGYPHDYVSLF